MKNVDIILRSLAINAPILKAWGVALNRPLFLIGDTRKTAETIKALSKHPYVIDSSESLQEITRKLKLINSEAVVMELPLKKLCSNVKFMEKMQAAINHSEFNSSMTGYQLFFAGTYAENYLVGDVYEVPLTYFPESLDRKVEVVPSPEELNIVRDIIAGFDGIERDRISLHSAAAFAFPYLQKENRLSDYEALQTTADRLFDFWKEETDQSSLQKTVAILLFDAVKADDYAVQKIENIKGDFEKLIIVDFQEDSLLMTLETFKIIFKKLIDLLSYTETKCRLSELGIVELGYEGCLTRTFTIIQDNLPVKKKLVKVCVKDLSIFKGNRNIQIVDYIKNI
ncbi:MAG TPA: hypothetical protein DEO40_05615 [Treponema sp.]|nr:hypothetical protein [Treponema sp.]